ncbi:hypothetical protein ACWGB8_27655 [Kitasatospora sp. NPDC054939]
MHARKALAVMSTVLAVVAGTAVTTPAASAAANKQAGGYGCAGTLVWSGGVVGHSGAGTVYTYLNGAMNCSVFVKSAYAGTATWTSISIQNSDNDLVWRDTDAGRYSSYAGPVYVDAPGKCIREWVYEEHPAGGLYFSAGTPWHSCG